MAITYMKILYLAYGKIKIAIEGNLTQNFPQEITLKMRSDWIELSQKEKHFTPRKKVCKSPNVENLRSERRMEGGKLAAKKSKQRTL